MNAKYPEIQFKLIKSSKGRLSIISLKKSTRFRFNFETIGYSEVCCLHQRFWVFVTLIEVIILETH